MKKEEVEWSLDAFYYKEEKAVEKIAEMVKDDCKAYGYKEEEYTGTPLRSVRIPAGGWNTARIIRQVSKEYYGFTRAYGIMEHKLIY